MTGSSVDFCFAEINEPSAEKGVAAWSFLTIGAFPVCRNCTDRESSKPLFVAPPEPDHANEHPF
jgi:hypothetical protein